METILREVMLNKIEFNQEENSICFEFYDTSTGDDIGKVICKNIFKVDMNAGFLRDEEKFPCFVLDITYGELNVSEVVKSFKWLNYSFRNLDEPMIPKSETYWYLGIEGGPIEIHVISENIENILDEYNKETIVKI